MERNDIKEQLIKLDTVYEKFTMTPEMFEIWVDCFKDADKKIFEQAIIETMQTEEYAPNIATVNRHYKAIEAERKAVVDTARGCYYELIDLLGEKKNADDYAALLKMIADYPRGERIEAIEDFRDKAASYANKHRSDGTEMKSLAQLIKEYKG